MITDKSISRWLYIVLLLACIPCFWSCGNVRNLQYMQGQFDTAKLSQVKYPEITFQKNDLLSVAVYSDNNTASSYYNLPAQTSVLTAGATTPLAGSTPPQGSTYLVDDAGNIQFPGLGALHVEGLTKQQFYALLESKLRDKLQNPYFIIRLANYRITLIGEVNQPGQYSIPNERVSVLEAIGLAGDLTVYGRRENVLIIREQNGERTFGRLNLKSPDIMTSPYFYLQPNDVVYVDLNRNKAAANDAVAVRNISLVVSVISVVAILVGVLQ
jgi:polysaccharide biosynthesis/export protein